MFTKEVHAFSSVRATVIRRLYVRSSKECFADVCTLDHQKNALQICKHKLDSVGYSVTLWRLGVAIFVTETQQCVLFVLLLTYR
jgi:hypothetical protein